MPLHGRSCSLLWLCSLRELLAFQIPSWETEMKTAFMKATAGSSSKELAPELGGDLSPSRPFCVPRCLPPSSSLLKLRPRVRSYRFLPSATPFSGSGLSVHGQQQPPAQTQTAQATQPGLVEHPQAALLLPLSPEAPKDPTALTGPAAWGASAEGTCSGLHPEWNRGAYSVNGLNLPNFVLSLFQSHWTKARGLRLGGEGSTATAPSPPPLLLLPTTTIRRGDTPCTPGAG